MKAIAPTQPLGSAILRAEISRSEKALAVVQRELATSRYSDVARSTGPSYSAVLQLRRDEARIDGQLQMHGLIKARFEGIQSQLGELASAAQSFVAEVLASQGAAGAAVLEAGAQSRIAQFIAVANGTLGGVHLFAGRNVDTAPFEPGLVNSGGTQRAALAAAFNAEFGFPPASPQASSIDAAALRQFLDTTFAAAFAPAPWSDWTSATTEAVGVPVDGAGIMTTTTSGAGQGFAKLLSAYIAAADFGAAALGDGARDTLKMWVTERAASAVQDFARTQSEIGIAEARLADARERSVMRKDVLTREIARLEQIDPYEAATRLSDILTRIETSYAITARLKDLSLLRYLR